MASGADYPGFHEPEPEQKQRIRAIGAFLEREFLGRMTAFLDLLKVVIASFIGALFALELNRLFAGEPPIDGLLQFYIVFGALYVVMYRWKAGFDRVKHLNS